MAPTPGTLPFYPPYQPGALPYTGQEILYLVNSATATAAASYRVLLTDVVGKAPSVMPGASPTPNDILAFYQVSSNTPRSTSVANFMTLQGNVAVGGTAGQIYVKNSATNFDAGWTTTLPAQLTITNAILGNLTVNTGLLVTNMTAVTATVSNLSVLTLQTAASIVATNISSNNFTAGSGNINSLTSAGANITSLTVTNATVSQNLQVATALAVGTSIPGAGVINASTDVQVNGNSVARMLLTTLNVGGLASAVSTVFSSTNFANYLVELNGLSPNTNTTGLQMQVATVGTTFVTGGYVSMVQTNVSSIITTDTSTTVILLSGTRATTSLSNSTTYGLNATFQVRRNNNAAPVHVIRGSGGYLSAGASGTTTVAMEDFVGYLDAAGQITAISIAPAAGTFTAVGTVKIYGLV